MLQLWIKMYNNSHKQCKSHNIKENKIMTNGRKTTFNERIEIVVFCIENNDNCQLTSDKYKVSYQQVYTWVGKYKTNGQESLVDNRGKSKTVEQMSDSQKLMPQNKIIGDKNKRLEMESDFLKKLEEIDSSFKKEIIYIAIKELNLQGYPISQLYDFAGIAISSYYKWLNRIESTTDIENSIIIKEIIRIYEEVSGIYGYRRITMNVIEL